MDAKKFIIAGIIGGIVDFMLGGLFYQVIFPSIYPPTPDMKMEYIGMGCLTYGFFMSYIFCKWANFSTFVSGAIGGATIGFFYGLSMNFFMYSNMPMNMQSFAVDVLINVLMSAGVGGVIAFVIGKLK